MLRTVLIVDPNAQSRTRTVVWLQQAGFVTDAVSSFSDARRRLTEEAPDVLITEAHLGEFHGLHLVILGRGRNSGLVAVMLGTPDPILAEDARRHEAAYVARPVTSDDLVSLVTELLEESSRRRRWPRKRIADGIQVTVNESVARMVDLSYGGLRLETSEETFLQRRHAPMRIEVPDFGVSIDTSVIWMNRSPSGSMVYGAALAETDPQKTGAWRQLVDRFEAAGM
jgi:DNA-binding response OmpR family regulator